MMAPFAMAVMLFVVHNGPSTASRGHDRAAASIAIPPRGMTSTTSTSPSSRHAPTSIDLRDAVENHPLSTPNSRETECLAKTVYHESRGDVLEGQMAVAQTVINRTQSNLFPDTICKVVLQPSQFSFVHKGVIPSVDRTSDAWKTAVAIAHLARSGWQGRARTRMALFFHAPRVSPNWGRPPIGRIGSHLFYS